VPRTVTLVPGCPLVGLIVKVEVILNWPTKTFPARTGYSAAAILGTSKLTEVPDGPLKFPDVIVCPPKVIVVVDPAKLLPVTRTLEPTGPLVGLMLAVAGGVVGVGRGVGEGSGVCACTKLKWARATPTNNVKMATPIGIDLGRLEPCQLRKLINTIWTHRKSTKLDYANTGNLLLVDTMVYSQRNQLSPEVVF